MTRNRVRTVVGNPVRTVAGPRARTIAEIELRRRWRRLRSNAGQLLATALFLLFFVPVALVALAGAFFFGAAIEAGDVDSPVQWVRAAFVYGWIGVVGFGGYRAYSIALRPDNVDGLLTTVSHRDLLGGLLLAEGLLWGVPVVTLGAAAAAAFALGLGSVGAIPFALLSIPATLSTALVTGFAIALLVRNGGVRSALLSRFRTAFLAALGIAYFWLLVTGSFASVLGPLYRVLAPTPIGWYGELALLGADVGVCPLRAGGALSASVALLAASIPVLDRLSAWLWYADGVSIEREASTERTTGRRSRLAGVVPGPILAVLGVDWKRARRAPITLSFALYPLIVLVNPVADAVRAGSVGSALPLFALVCGAWITGSLFALNVLGSAGSTLPVTLLGSDPGRALVGGHALAGATIGTPITVGAVAALAAAGPYPPAAVATLTLSALVLATGAGFLASGIGVLFPRFEAVSVSRSTKAIVPSVIAFGVYSVLFVLVALPAALGHSAIVGGWAASALETSRLVVQVVGTLLSTILVVALGGVSALFSIRRVESYHFD